MTQHAVSSEIRGVNFLTQRAVSTQIGSVNIISVASQLQILLDHLLQLLGPDGGTCVVYIYLGLYGSHYLTYVDYKCVEMRSD